MCVLRFLETFEEEEVVNEVAAELKEVEERIKKEQTDAKKNTDPAKKKKGFYVCQIPKMKKLHHLKKNKSGARRSQEWKEMGVLSSGGEAGVAHAPPASACFSIDRLVQ